MELTNNNSNNTVSATYNAGFWDWGSSYMFGADKKGGIVTAWNSGRVSSDILFGRRLLWEIR